MVLHTPGTLLRSSNQFLLSTFKFNLKTYGGRSFTIAAPSVSNLDLVTPFLLLNLCLRLGFLKFVMMLSYRMMMFL